MNDECLACVRLKITVFQRPRAGKEPNTEFIRALSQKDKERERERETIEIEEAFLSITFNDLCL